MKPFRFIIAIFGVLLLLVCGNTQGNPSVRVSQEQCFVPDMSPPPAQMIAIQPQFGQSLQVERGVSVPILFSIRIQPEAVATAKGSGSTYYINNNSQEILRAWQLKQNAISVNPETRNNKYIELFKQADKAFYTQYPEYQYLRFASDLGDRYAPQTYLNKQYGKARMTVKDLIHLQPASHYRAREKV